jgi:hypothetical protein
MKSISCKGTLNSLICREMPPSPNLIRYRVDPGDVPSEKAARRLGLTLDQFNKVLPNLLARGFPPADPDTSMYDLEAIDLWRRRRHAAGLELTAAASVAQHVVDPMAERFHAAKIRQTSDRRRHRGAS